MQFYTISQTIALYKKSMKKWETQYNDERDIVRSVPERKINIASVGDFTSI